LFQHIKSKGIFSEANAIIVMKNLLGALAYIHQRGIIHRDIKPENLIMVDKDINSANKIADFGLATIMEKDIPESLKCGSPGYVGTRVTSSRSSVKCRI
jgi:serine/threonine protein kinase